MTEKALQGAREQAGPVIREGETMTVQGAVNKTLLLSALLFATAMLGFMWGETYPWLMWVGAIGGLITVLIAAFRPQHSPILAPVYAGLEGLFVGAISAMYASLLEGIVFQAITLTIAVLFMMLFIYKAGIIKVTQKFRLGVIMATGGILVFYLLSFVLSFFGIDIGYLHDGGWMSIGISLVIVGVASLNLLLDFDNFEKGEQHGAPGYMEWFCALGLLVTLVWLYVEMLRLIALFSSND